MTQTLVPVCVPAYDSAAERFPQLAFRLGLP